MCGWHAQNRVRNCGTKNQPTSQRGLQQQQEEEAKKRTSCSIICRQSSRSPLGKQVPCRGIQPGSPGNTHSPCLPRPPHLPPCVRHWLSANRQCPVHICQKETEREGERESEREIERKGNTERELVVVALVALKTVLATHTYTHTHAGKTEIETV